MDALRLLGSLLGNNATSSGLGGQIINQLANRLTNKGSALGHRRAASPGVGGQIFNQALGHRAGSTLGKAGMASLLGGLAITALQQFAQRNPAAAHSRSPLGALTGAMGLAPPAAVGSAPIDTQALTLVKAMINAAKADGQIDAEEQRKIVAKLSDVGPEEIEFVKQEMARPLNMDFLNAVDPSLAAQVYAVSLMAINLDTAAEVNYLQQLGQRLGLDRQAVNDIHTELGLHPLYST